MSYYRRYRPHFIKSWLFLGCLFILTATIAPVMASANRNAANNSPQAIVRAQKLYQAGDFSAAIPLWQQAATDFRESADSQNEAMALSNLSLTYQQLGEWQAAQTAIADSLQLLADDSDSKSLVKAQTLEIQGKLQRETGRADEALTTWQSAAQIYQQLDNSEALAQNNLNQAQALRDLGLYPRACKRLLRNLSLANIDSCQDVNQLAAEDLEQKLKPIIARPNLNSVRTLRNLGELLLITGEPQQSAQVLEANLQLASKLESLEPAQDYLSLGNTYKALAEGAEVRSERSQYEQQALDAYNRAAQSSNSLTRQNAALNQLSLLIAGEKWSAAEQLWRSLYTDLTEADLTAQRQQIYAQINYAQHLIQLAQVDDADHTPPTLSEIKLVLDRGIEGAQILGDRRTEAYAWGSLGRLYEVEGESELAKTATRRGLQLISSFEAADIAYQYYWQLGRIYQTQDNTTEAISAYTQAYNALQSLRSDIATINPEVQFSFRDEVEPVYRGLVELDVKSAQELELQGDKAASQARLIQARDVVESLQVAQLNNFFREACVDANPQAIDKIDSSAAVIYPIILADELAILLSLPNQPPQLFTSQVAETELLATIDAIRSTLLFPGEDRASSLALYQQAYSWLVAPLAAELENNQVKTIAFVLDGSLRSIPMSVLHDGDRYLVEKYALALTPGLQLLDPKPLAAVQLEAITGGLSEIRTDFQPHKNFSDLPKVSEELAAIKTIGLSDATLLNSQFTKQALKQRIASSNSPIIHLATHAQFSSQAKDTFILAWDGQINISELDDLLRDDTFTRNQAIELLVLSACETASGDPRATLGLAGVAVQAGARSTVATLWSVVDESTAQLMTEFYRQLARTDVTQANKAETLRQAQLSLIKSQRFDHPHFWAPFILIGNWQ